MSKALAYSSAIRITWADWTHSPSSVNHRTPSSASSAHLGELLALAGPA